MLSRVFIDATNSDEAKGVYFILAEKMTTLKGKLGLGSDNISTKPLKTEEIVVMQGHFGDDRVSEVTLSLPQLAKILEAVRNENGRIDFKNLYFACCKRTATPDSDPGECFIHFPDQADKRVVVNRHKIMDALTTFLHEIFVNLEFEKWLASKCQEADS